MCAKIPLRRLKAPKLVSIMLELAFSDAASRSINCESRFSPRLTKLGPWTRLYCDSADSFDSSPSTFSSKSCSSNLLTCSAK